MSPAYARVHGFDETHTRFASKYSLYLYREQGKDPLPDADGHSLQLSGTPVLFIPGNAGSYKQVRSLASQSANFYYTEFAKCQDLNPNVNNLDFFSADFNEDFTAFHGRTMLDQAEYLNDAIGFILSLYRHNPTPARSVILVGHSMGGIVARVMLSLPNYVEDSVNTILTLAAPHAAAPATFDADLLHVFASTDDFWRHGFVNSGSAQSALNTVAKRRLKDVALISVTGGLLDNMLPADYTALTGLVPESNGFTIATTGIPGVWTPIDHLAIVWCDQLRKVLASSLLQLVDKTSETKTYPLEKRMEILRKNLLTGFEEEAVQDFDSYKAGTGKLDLPYKLKIDTKQLKDTSRQRNLQLPKSNPKDELSASPDMHLFYIPKDGLKFKFNFLSSLPPVDISSLGKRSSAPSILLCRTLTPDGRSFKKEFDYTSDTTSKAVQLECIDFHKDVHKIPRSYNDSESATESSLGADKNPFYSVQLDSRVLSMFDAVVIAESPSPVIRPDFVLADLELTQSTDLVLGDFGLWKLFSRGYDVTLPAHRPISVNVKVPSAWSSLLAYNFDIRYQQSQMERFSPILSQRVRDETKWHINLHDDKALTALIQGVSPFCPFTRDEDSSLELQLFSDSLASDQIMDIYLTVNWFKSLKLLVLKYRLSVFSFPVFVTTLVLFLQFKKYIQDDIFPSFGEGLLMLCDLRVLTPLMLLLSFLSSFASQAAFQKLLSYIDPVDFGNVSLMQEIEKSDVYVNLYFLGLEEKALWFFGPVALVISLALVCAFYNILSVLLWIITSTLRKLHVSNMFKSSKVGVYNRRRATGTAIILALVPLYIPYQFPYVVSCLVQSTVVIRAYLSSSVQRNNSVENFRNFNFSLLMLMLWILPVNVPVLIVWIHNFSLRWATPFSSHHNFLAIISIVFLVQNNVAGNIVPRPTSPVTIFVTKFLIAYFSLCSLIYGTRHLFWLHYLLNFLCAWLLLLLMEANLSGHVKNIATFKREDSSSKLH
ncbi:hypothetical protein OGAPHI_001782 [Ogataea philodendri]|uniref:GPI inositol-deacylase n=1 Tax=Ogataea philodendri TaxID=1378263 RepID=A0A9P8T6F3_9ASCO|nr:uncharacterized protein OGAPHI_001782 [Ogataea philodendri]KAH3668028.1 hypothetical protein OGAPHI_001782 [Ogataea philodendri]